MITLSQARALMAQDRQLRAIAEQVAEQELDMAQIPELDKEPRKERLNFHVIINLPDDREEHVDFKAFSFHSVQKILDYKYEQWTSLVVTITR
jgi:hypothetical protein